jgi:DNA invertase Pin-like site-specific DNA recombinase
MKIGYTRVSKQEQNEALQRDALKEEILLNQTGYQSQALPQIISQKLPQIIFIFTP